MKKSKILRKLRNLKAMSADKSSEKEAEIAMRQYHSLCAKYNIEESELDEDNKEPIMEDSFEGRNYQWRRTIADGIADLYFCKFYYTDCKKKEFANYHFIGSEINVLFATEITKYVIDIVLKTCEKFTVKQNILERQKFRESFRRGAANRIQKRCFELIKESCEEKPSDNLPCLLNAYKEASKEIKAFMEESGIYLHTVYGDKNFFNNAAYNLGSSQADSISLRKNVKTNQLLLENQNG